MSHAKLIFLPLLAALLTALSAGCSNTTEPQKMRTDLRGRVVEADGQPIAGATVVLQYDVDPPLSSAAVRAPDKIATEVQFLLSVPGEVTMWLSSYCDQDTVRLLISGVLPAGRHSVIWNGRDDEDRSLPDGVYWVHLVTPDATTRHDILLLHLGYNEMEGMPAPLASTDEDGSFSLDQLCLPFGHAFEATDELGEPTGTITITRSVRVWAFSPAHRQFGSSWVTVSAETGAVANIELADKPRDL